MTDELAGARSESVNQSAAMDPIAMQEESTPGNEAIEQGFGQPRSWRQKGNVVCKFYQVAGGKCKLSIRNVSFHLGSFELLWGVFGAVRYSMFYYASPIFFYFTRGIVSILYSLLSHDSIELRPIQPHA